VHSGNLPVKINEVNKMAEERWVRGLHRELLFRKNTVNGRTLVYGKDAGFEGSARERFSRDPKGHIVARGNHPDLIHEDADDDEEDEI
jgi:hypothetical protein